MEVEYVEFSDRKEKCKSAFQFSVNNLHHDLFNLPTFAISCNEE